MGLCWQEPFCCFSLSLDFILFCFHSLHSSLSLPFLLCEPRFSGSIYFFYSLFLAFSVVPLHPGCFAFTLDQTGSHRHTYLMLEEAVRQSKQFGFNFTGRFVLLQHILTKSNVEIWLWILSFDLFLCHICFFPSPLLNFVKMTKSKQWSYFTIFKLKHST